jgi:RNA polymerase sigma-70 factor (ECF subfamily)
MDSEAFLQAAVPDVSDFRSLFLEQAGFVWRVLKRHGIADRDLEDACQEVFLVVHRRRADFEGRSSLRTWLYGIAVRVALSLRRRAHLQREQLVAQPPEGRSEAVQEQRLADARTLTWLQSVLLAMDAEKREAFVLYELEGMTVAELAAATDVPETTALYRLHQAREEVLRKSKRAALSEPKPPLRQRQAAGGTHE